MTAASVPRRELPIRWIGWAAAALLVVIFVIQLPFFFAWGSYFVTAYAFNYLWAFVVLLLATAFTRTVSLRLLALAWFVGVYPVTGAMLLVGRPLADIFGLQHAIIPGFILPLTEELIKLIPILLLFWWTARRGLWQLSATDGLLVGFMIGAGVAFHEDMMFGRVFGSGPTGWPPLSYAFPTIYSFRGVVGAYHEIWLALIGLAIGAAFLLRHRTRLAWILPVAAWLIVFTDHWSNNYTIDPNAEEPFLTIANAFRAVVLDGALLPILLLIAIASAIAWELRILSTVGRRDPLFNDVGAGDVVKLARGSAPWLGKLRHIQTLRIYARRRRGTYYAVWCRRPPASDERLLAMGAGLHELADAGGVPIGDSEAPATAEET